MHRVPAQIGRPISRRRTARQPAAAALAGGTTLALLALLAAPGGATGCAGDCDGDGAVRIAELVRGVGIALNGIALA